MYEVLSPRIYQSYNLRGSISSIILVCISMIDSDDRGGLHLNQRQVLYLLRNMDESGRLLRNAISRPGSFLSPPEIPEWKGPSLISAATETHLIPSKKDQRKFYMELIFVVILLLQVYVCTCTSSFDP